MPGSVRTASKVPLMARRVGGSALLPIALAALLCLAGIGSKSLWGDEAFSVALARSSWGEFWHMIFEREVNMSLYYVLLKLWTTFGSSEAWVRSLSALFAVGAVAAVYLLGSRLLGKFTGFVAALLLAVNAFFVHYAQETRGYSLVLLLVALSTYLFVICLDEPTTPNVLAYTVVSAAAAYAHFFALFAIAAQLVTLVVAHRQRARRRLLPGFAVMGILLAPLILFVLGRNGDQINWIPRPTVGNFVHSVRSLTGESRGLLLGYAILVAVALAVAYRERRHRDRWPWVLLVASVAVPVVGSFVVSYAKPIFISRYLIVSLPGLVVLAAAGIVRFRPRALGALALAAVLILSSRTLRYWYADYKKEDWRSATSFVLERTQPGDAAVFYRPGVRIPFDYYVTRNDRAYPLDPLFPQARYGRFDLRRDRVRVPDLRALSVSERLAQRVWLVTGNYAPADVRRPEQKKIEQQLAHLAPRRLHRVYTGEGSGIVVSLFDLR